MGSHSVISAGGMTVEVKGKQVFINGRPAEPRMTVEQARTERLHSFFLLGVGFVLGAFATAIFMAIQ